MLYRLLVTTFFCFSLQALGPLAFLLEKQGEAGQTFTKQVEKNIEELEKKKIESEEAQSEYKIALEGVQKTLAAFKERLKKVRGTEFEFISQHSAIANKTVQTLSEIIQVLNELKSTLESHIKLLQEYKQDPEFKLKGLQIPQKSIYSIDILHKINGTILNYEDELKVLKERLKKISVDSERLQKSQLLVQQEYDEKKRDQKSLKDIDSEEKDEQQKLSLKQRGELIDAEVRLLEYKKDLADIKIREAAARALFIQQNSKIAKIQLEILDRQRKLVQQNLKVEKKDLEEARKTLDRKISESNQLQESYRKRIDALEVLKQTDLEEIAKLKKQYSLSEKDIDEINNWVYEPTKIAQWEALIGIGQLHNQVVLEIEINKDTWLARIEQEKAKVKEQEVNNLITQSWYTLTSHRLDGYQREYLLKEIKQYEKIRSDIQLLIGSLADRHAAALNLLTQNTRLASSIDSYLKLFRNQKNTVFKDQANRYLQLGQVLRDKIALETEKRGETLAQLIDVYNTTTNILELTIKKVDAVIAVLSTKAQWEGAPPFWKTLRSFIPDMKKFVSHVVFEQSFQQNVIRVQEGVFNVFSRITQSYTTLFKALLYAVLLFLLYLFIKRYLPIFASLITSLLANTEGIIFVAGNFMSAILFFIARHLRGMYTWLILFIGVKYCVKNGLIDAYLGALFCLFSLLLWLIYVYRFVAHIKEVNRTQGYIFVSESYQRKFFSIFSLFFYSSIILLFLREALIFTFPKSDTPRTLLTLNFILLQVSLIFMISREQLQQIIPRETPFLLWVSELLDTYYYLFLGSFAFVILMSNPYIGYGPQFFFVITRFVLVALVISLFVVLHNYMKKWAVSLFFVQKGEGMKERFNYGKTYYGLFIIISFVLFAALTFIAATNIWGYALGYEEIAAWLQKELYTYESRVTGRYNVVNMLDILKVFLFYVLGGVALAYFINKFVLDRMFDLLLVNIGIQSALLTLSRTVIISTGIIIGLQSIGLEGLVFYIFAVLGGLGFAAKEVITDVIAYFIILIQRPIRIGDFIALDRELLGIVRHLTVRSIVVRKKNSVTLLIPNSFILTKPVTSWNYSHTYFAFDDILLTVIYSADPVKVKSIILQVLDDNINILKNPAPIVRLNEFSDSGFEFLIRAFLSPDKVLDRFDIASDVRMELVKAIRAHGYDLGSPVLAVHIIPGQITDKDLQ